MIGGTHIDHHSPFFSSAEGAVFLGALFFASARLAAAVGYTCKISKSSLDRI